MFYARKDAKTQRLSIRVGGTRAWIIFTLLSCIFYLPAFAQKPNIITIITDDQGWGDIGYNNPKVYTPHLDALAAESALCTRHYSMPQCTPTRIAAFTGRYPGRFGNAGLTASNEPVFPHGTLNLATFLKANAYQTYLSGKWHMGVAEEHGPHHHGFDSSYGSFAGGVGYYDHRYRARLPEFEVTWHRDGKIIEGYENGVHVTDLVTDEAVRIIKKHAKKSNHQAPSADDGAGAERRGGTERSEIDSRKAAPQGGDRGGASMQASCRSPSSSIWPTTPRIPHLTSAVSLSTPPPSSTPITRSAGSMKTRSNGSMTPRASSSLSQTLKNASSSPSSTTSTTASVRSSKPSTHPASETTHSFYSPRTMAPRSTGPAMPSPMTSSSPTSTRPTPSVATNVTPTRAVSVFPDSFTGAAKYPPARSTAQSTLSTG